MSGVPHIKSVLIKNFLSFINQIKNSDKTVSKVLLEVIKLDVNSVTGSNLRSIMNLVNKTSIEDLDPQDSKSVVFHPVPINEEWRIGLVKEIIDIRNQVFHLEGFTADEVNHILDFVCTT